jgi:riboflavin-specific deaminase-like protein
MERFPAITVHYAQTLDGRIATCTGHSQWISGEESLCLAHRLRAEHEAVMVGRGTVLADNPRLTVRLVPGRSPIRIVIDSTLRTPEHAHVLTDGAAPTLVATTARAPRDRVESLRLRGIEVAVLAEDEQGQVCLPELMRYLGERGIKTVLVEGGRGLITGLLRQRLVDRLIVCIAPKIVGAGIEAIGDLGIDTMDGALTFTQSSVTTLGEDIIFDGQVARDRALVPPRP